MYQGGTHSSWVRGSVGKELFHERHQPVEIQVVERLLVKLVDPGLPHDWFTEVATRHPNDGKIGPCTPHFLHKQVGIGLIGIDAGV